MSGSTISSYKSSPNNAGLADNGKARVASYDRYHKAYFWSFVCALILCWSPFNLLAYLAPFIAAGIFILLSGSHAALRNVVLWFLAWGIIIAVYFLLTPGFVLHSALLSILTYGSFLLVVAVPSRFIASLGLLERMLVWARWMVILQALVGIVQAAYGFSLTGSFDAANGDFVEGTIHLALQSERTFSNPMFAINMGFLLIALLPDLILRRKGTIAIALGGIALILASVLHVLLMIAVAAVIVLFLYWPISLRRRMTYLGLVGLVIASVAAYFVLEGNFGTANSFARSLLSGESFRTRAIQRAVLDMPEEYPLLPLVGLGPGQFSSRAGLIGTGLYFGGPVYPRPLPYLPQGMSAALEEYTLDLWVAYARLIARSAGGGSTHQPFLSWLSVYVEWGVLVLAAAFGLVVYLLLRVRLVVRTYSQRVLAASFGMGLLFVLFLGAQENYWEVPQAILVGIMMMKVQYAILMSPEARAKLT